MLPHVHLGSDDTAAGSLPRASRSTHQHPARSVQAALAYDEPMSRSHDAPILLGPFEVGPELGRGGIGRVYRAVHPRSGVAVAVKVLLDHGDQVGNARFEQEVATVARLRHPHIVRIFDYGRLPDGRLGPEGSPYLVMERCSGGSLQERRRDLTHYEGVHSVLQALLDALGHAHAAGITHRDVKLSNVLVGTGEDLRPGLRLADFGMAGGTHQPARGGTPAYMPPEQFERGGRIGPWTDLYAVGVLAWRLVTGVRPFPGRGATNLLAKCAENTRPLHPRMAVPRGFEAWVRVLLRARWQGRFLSAAAAADALGSLVGPSLVGPSQVGPDDDKAALTELASGGAFERLPDTAPRHPPAPRAKTPGPWVDRAWVPSSTLLAAGEALLRMRDPILTGRSETCRAIWGALVAARHQGRGACIAVIGPDGSGRRRVLDEVRQRWTERAGGFSASLGAPLVSPRALLHEVLDLRADQDAGVRLAELEVASPPVVEALARLEEADEDLGWRLVISILGTLARRFPVTLAVPDLDVHPNRAGLVERIRARDQPLVWLVSSQRPVQVATSGVALPPLPDDALRRLLESWASLHWETVRDSIQAASGQPGLLVRTLRRAALVPTVDGLRAEPRPPMDVPDTLRAAAVCLGLIGPFVDRRAADALRVEGVQALLDALGRLGAVEARSGGWSFVHPADAERLATLDGEPPRERCAQVARVLEDLGAWDRAIDLRLRAGQPLKAVEAFDTHCRWSLTVGRARAFVEALHAFSLQERVQGEARILLVRIAHNANHPDALAMLEETERLARTLDWKLTWARCQMHRGMFHRLPVEEVIEALLAAPQTPKRDGYLSRVLPDAGRYREAMPFAESSLDPVDRLQVLSGDALARGALQEAAEHLRQALAVSPPMRRASLLISLQSVLGRLDEAEDALAVGEEAIAWCRIVGRPDRTVVALLNQAFVHARAGSWGQAARYAAAALELPDYLIYSQLCRLILAVETARHGDRAPLGACLPRVLGALRELRPHERRPAEVLLRGALPLLDDSDAAEVRELLTL